MIGLPFAQVAPVGAFGVLAERGDQDSAPKILVLSASFEGLLDVGEEAFASVVRDDVRPVPNLGERGTGTCSPLRACDVGDREQSLHYVLCAVVELVGQDRLRVRELLEVLFGPRLEVDPNRERLLLDLEVPEPLYRLVAGLPLQSDRERPIGDRVGQSPPISA